ncbi:alpha/beta fold hydrolase [Pseudomonas sp. BBP2017]|uniref:alpha/beta fold hydrolase n=1 Tax=Pseudomonas sp. BBP2017 TaxID=2109731 RepID=UPI000D1214EE|nr:alpha/beta fold hydrolase [Pseudomonas sp. BBP2017]PSS59116.1 alpha/beta hydrolase [Pseudomonas sp. BBP2017]
MTALPSRLIFLPGASGNTDFWRPAAQSLAYPAAQLHIGWPGFGPTPADSGVNSMDDLVTRLLPDIDQPTALIAQSMGGIVAVLTALQRPERITHLVLSVTSGGVNMPALGAQDWRPAFADEFPSVPRWFIDDHSDLSERLAELQMPVLLLWGDNDPISPVRVGEHLARLLPCASLHVLEGAGHDLGFSHAAEVAKLIDRHLLG